MKNAKTALTCIQALRDRGEKITRARSALLSYLCEVQSPVSAYAMLDDLRAKGITINRTTVYRELDFLCREGFAEEVHFKDSKKLFEIVRDHHHHLVCTKCGRVEDVRLNRDVHAEEKRIHHEYGFRVARHSLEFFGVCKECIPA